MNELRKLCFRVRPVRTVQCISKRSYIVSNNEMTQLDELPEGIVREAVSRTKEFHILRSEWENLMLYGPKQNGLKKESVKQDHKSNRAKFQEMKALEQDLQKNFCVADQKILGNADNQSNAEKMLTSLVDSSAVYSAFTATLTVNNHHNDKYPLFAYDDAPLENLATYANKMLNLRAVVDLTVPSVISVLNSVMPKNDKETRHMANVEFALEHGVNTFYACRDAYERRKSAFYGQLQNYVEASSKQETCLEEDETGWQSVVPHIKNLSEFHNLQMNVSHPHLFYHDFIGCVGIYNSKPSLVEFVFPNLPFLTTSTIASLPLQAVAHLGLVNSSKLKYKVENILVLTVNTQGVIASTALIEKDKCEELWNLWIDKLTQYWHLQRDPVQNHFDVE